MPSILICSTTANKDAVARLRGELGISNGTLVIGNVARLEEVKNHAKMIEIARQMKSLPDRVQNAIYRKRRPGKQD